MKGAFPNSYHWVVATIAVVALAAVILDVPGAPENFFSPNSTTSPKPEGQQLYIPSFTDQTYRSGLFFSHVQGGEVLAGLDETLGSGACAFDYDNDGWLDLFLIGGSGQTHHFGHQQWWQEKRGNRLFHNLGEAKFEDVTAKAGLEESGSPGMGCVHADLDNDGDQELFVTTRNGNHLYRNNGDGTFKEVTAEAGIQGNAWSTSAAIADYDGDGQLDIYVANYIKFDKHARTLESDAGFLADPPPMFDASLFDAEPNCLYHNLGGLKFQDEAQSAGVNDEAGRGLSALWLDVNNDHLPDLVVGNDKQTPSRLFINRGNGTFSSAGEEFGVNNNIGFQSLASGDVNGDGSTDLIAGTPSGELLKLLLYRKDNKVPFFDYARDLGLSDARFSLFSTWATGVYDFNLDGTLDLMALNGLRQPDPDAHRISTGQPKTLLLNNRHGFEDVSGRSGQLFSDSISARGGAFGDFDNDGDIDVLAMHNNNPAQLLLNESSNRTWVGIRLQGKVDNRDAIGSKVELISASGSQYRDLSAGSGFLSDHDRRLQFGLAGKEPEVSLRVTWPDGSTNHYSHLQTNRYHLLRQGEESAQTITVKKTVTEKSGPVRLLFGNSDGSFQAELLQWLIEAGERKQAFVIANALMHDSHPSVRKRVMELIGNLSFSVNALPALESGIYDPESEVRLATVLTLRTYEDENTVYWLLRAMDDSDENVRIAAIETFEHLFREEEAMVNKKQLAIPILITELDDPSEAVSAAAARALGEAESYRGALPLTGLINSSRQEVQIQAIRSLGLLRAIHATESLTSIACSSRSASKARAHALIALKRLGTSEADAFIRRQFDLFNGAIDASTAEIYSFLLTEEGGTVFDRRVFLDNLHGWLRKQDVDPADANRLIGVISNLKSIAGEYFHNDLKRYIHSRNSDLRQCAFEALFQAPSPPAAKMINAAISDSDDAIRNLALESAISHRISLSPKKLFELANQEPTAKNASFLIARQLSPDIENRLVRTAMDRATDQQIRILALSALDHSGTTDAHEAMKSILFDAAESPQVRSQALRSFATAMPGHSDLIKLTHLRHDPLSMEALNILAKQNNDHAITTLWRMLENSNQSEEDRIFAAKALHPLFPQRTISTIMGNQQ